MKASAAKGENFEVLFTLPVLGAEAVVVITAEPLLPHIVVTADSDCMEGCCCGVELKDSDREVCNDDDDDCGGNFAMVTIEVSVADDESLLPMDKSR